MFKKILLLALVFILISPGLVSSGGEFPLIIDPTEFRLDLREGRGWTRIGRVFLFNPLRDGETLWDTAVRWDAAVIIGEGWIRIRPLHGYILNKGLEKARIELRTDIDIDGIYPPIGDHTGTIRFTAGGEYKDVVIYLKVIPVPAVRSNLMWPPSPAIPPTILTVETPLGSEKYYFVENVDTAKIIRYFFEWMIVLGGLAAFIAFVWAGLLYMTSVGDANKMTEAKKKMRNALLGLVLLLASVLIFNYINPMLTVLEPLPELTP